MDPLALVEPPGDLFLRTLDTLDFAERMFRSHNIHQSPVFFGKSGLHRFDAPDNSYGVLYAGCDAYCAFVETFAKNAGTRAVTTAALARNSLAQIKAIRPLLLIDLTPSGALVRIGADANLFSGDHKIAQLWSKALHDHPCKADGLLYPSRLDPHRRSVALFGDRAPKLIELDREAWYVSGPQRRLLAGILEHYRVELVENRFRVPRKPADRARQSAFVWDDP